jgi:hypothetical protein
MGFEPTTFCMASRTCAASPARKIPANRRFRLRERQAPIPRLYPGDHGNFRTQTGPGRHEPPGFSRPCHGRMHCAKRARGGEEAPAIRSRGRSVTNQAASGDLWAAYAPDAPVDDTSHAKAARRRNQKRRALPSSRSRSFKPRSCSSSQAGASSACTRRPPCSPELARRSCPGFIPARRRDWG